MSKVIELLGGKSMWLEEIFFKIFKFLYHLEFHLLFYYSSLGVVMKCGPGFPPTWGGNACK